MTHVQLAMIGTGEVRRAHLAIAGLVFGTTSRRASYWRKGPSSTSDELLTQLDGRDLTLRGLHFLLSARRGASSRLRALR